MARWRKMKSAPMDGTPIEVKTGCGIVAVAEYWAPPPPEIDPEQTFGGWAVNIAQPFCEGKVSGDIDLSPVDLSPVAWRPLPDGHPAFDPVESPVF